MCGTSSPKKKYKKFIQNYTYWMVFSKSNSEKCASNFNFIHFKILHTVCCFLWIYLKMKSRSYFNREYLHTRRVWESFAVFTAVFRVLLKQKEMYYMEANIRYRFTLILWSSILNPSTCRYIILCGIENLEFPFIDLCGAISTRKHSTNMKNVKISFISFIKW